LMVSPCLPWRKLLSLAERPPLTERLALVERPRRRAAHRARASRRRGRRPLAGLGERSKAVSEALTTVARARASDKAELQDDEGPAGSAPPRG
jgi:hypothetical protein